MKKSRRKKRKTGCVGGEHRTRPRAVSAKYVPSFHFRKVCPYLSIDKGSEISHDSPQSVFGNHSCLDCRPYNNILHTLRAQLSNIQKSCPAVAASDSAPLQTAHKPPSPTPPMARTYAPRISLPYKPNYQSSSPCYTASL